MVLGRKRDARWDGTERRSAALVLVVNNDPDACEMLVRLVGTAGYRPIGATTDEQAWTQITRQLPRCVVLDTMGGGSGSSLKMLELIRSSEDQRVSSSRVVLCATSRKHRSFSFQSGADAFVLRPFHLDDLLTAIADVLRRPNEERAEHRRDELARLGK